MKRAGRSGRRARPGDFGRTAAQFRAVFPMAKVSQGGRDQERAECSPDEALVEIIRRLLEGLGPVATVDWRRPWDSAPTRSPPVRASKRKVAMRGLFTPAAGEENGASAPSVAHPPLHHQAFARRDQPVPARDFLRFLFCVAARRAQSGMARPKALDTILVQLEGFGAPARGVGGGESSCGCLPTTIRTGSTKVPRRSSHMDAAALPPCRGQAAREALRRCAPHRRETPAATQRRLDVISHQDMDVAPPLAKRSC